MKQIISNFVYLILGGTAYKLPLKKQLVLFCLILFVVLITLILFASFSCNQEQADNRIFRNITIGNNGTLILGEYFNSKEKFATKVDDNIYQLRKYVFEGATLISIHLNDDGMISMMRFEYDPDTDYNEHVKIYSEILGSPFQTQQTDLLKKFIWDDSSTRFEYIKEPGEEKTQVYSALYDKGLWGE